MNLVYFKFLFATTIKKRPVWITWLLYLFTATMFIIVLPAAARVNPYHVWANTTMAICQSFLGMTVALFTAVLAINVFKDSNEEGTELIIISKPISRPKIILTKFLLFGLFCIMVNLTAVIVSAFTIFIPGTEKEFYWGLVVSMLIGNLVSFAVFGSIAILLSVKFAKVGIIITNIILSLVFLIYQSLTLFVFSTPLKKVTSDGIVPITYVYADRNLDRDSPDYGTYQERNFVYLDVGVNDKGEMVPKPDEGMPFTWKDMVDYWEDDVKAKDPSRILNITDLAGQVALTYLSTGVDKYSEREAYRMFAFSRFWDYKLTSPVSPEIIDPGEYRTVVPSKRHTIPMLYFGAKQEVIEGVPILYIPTNYLITGVRSSKEASLAGTYGRKIPIAFIRTKDLFSSRDIYFEADLWKKYEPAFEIIYNNVFKWNVTSKKSAESIVPYYDDMSESDQEQKVTRWCRGNKNIAKFYALIWACLTGHSSESDYFGENRMHDEQGNPYDAEFFDIHDVNDLNDRFMQFKHYCFYRAWDDQNKMFHSEPITQDEKDAKAVAIEAWSQESLSWFPTVKMTEGTWMMQSADETLIHVVEPGTEIPNIDLLIRTKDKYKTSTRTDEEMTSCAYAQYLNTGSIATNFCDVRDTYMYTSLDRPRRDATYSGEWYDQSHTWRLYLENELASWFGAYIPFGQNTEFFFYEINKTLEFWMYTIIWLVISSGLFCSGVIVYNKYDVK